MICCGMTESDMNSPNEICGENLDVARSNLRNLNYRCNGDRICSEFVLTNWSKCRANIVIRMDFVLEWKVEVHSAANSPHVNR